MVFIMKKHFFIFIFFIFSTWIFATSIKDSYDINVSFSPSLIINTDSNNKSAPSPIVYPISVSFRIPNHSLISFEPGLSFFYNYYLLDGTTPRPAEIENRTGTALSFLIDLPANFSFTIKENHTLEFEIGPSFLLRFITLANGVNASDFGESGSASNDVKLMNEYFWSNANFLYAKTSFSYLYKFSTQIKVGPEFKLYIPLGSLFNEEGFSNGIISLGIKIRF